MQFLRRCMVRYAFCSKSSLPNEHIQKIPSLKQFLHQQSTPSTITDQSFQSKIDNYSNQPQLQIRSPYTDPTFKPESHSFFIETYGCQMNVNDSQIVRSLLLQNYTQSPTKQQANIVLINTCAIRQAAQQKIYHRINEIKKNSNVIIGVLGCMAQRLKERMFKCGVHVVCGPDAYRDLPRLVGMAVQGYNGINVQLSVQETYAEVTPVRKNKDNVTAFLSIMRGCNNMCSFCIVPFVRGRQRSRTLDTILGEIEGLQKQGVKQITFLGQNVNSYHDTSSQHNSTHTNSEGFSQMFKLRNHPGYRFSHLLQHSAKAFPNIRFRFTSPHPKDFPNQVLTTINNYPNLCNYIHLPAQSGNTEMLFRMRRNHTRQSYLKLVQNMRGIIQNVAISTDLMCGFCGETDQMFQDTMSLIREVKFDMAYLFAYSMRQKTHAHRNFQDDIPQKIKRYRLRSMVDLFVEVQGQVNRKQQGKTHLLLIEGRSKRDSNKLMGKTDTFKKGYVDQVKLPVFDNGNFKEYRKMTSGDYVVAKTVEAGPRSLQCQPLGIVQKLGDFYTKRTQLDSMLEKEHTKKMQSLLNA